jgi:hypothetical protein
MRFMMLVYPGPAAETGALPTQKDIELMTGYNEELTKAGVLLALEGLHPTSDGVRVHFPGGKPVVTDGPFAEAKEIVGGYWLIQTRSKEEAIEWASRVPPLADHFIEVRQVYEMDEFGLDPESELSERVDRISAAVGQDEGAAGA